MSPLVSRRSLSGRSAFSGKPISAPALVLAAMLLFVLAASAHAGQTRLDVCHIPGGPQTIPIAEPALDAHLSHGDLLGSCNEQCATICDDGDACTIDDTGDCEELGCPDSAELVDCSDGVACTVDTCDPAAGCNSVPDVALCDDGVDCTVDECDSLIGCVNIADDSLCGGNEICEPGAGCVATGPACPCFTATELADTYDAFLAATGCEDGTGTCLLPRPDLNQEESYNVTCDNDASGAFSLGDAIFEAGDSNEGCGLHWTAAFTGWPLENGSGVSYDDEPATNEERQVCRSLIEAFVAERGLCP